MIVYCSNTKKANHEKVRLQYIQDVNELKLKTDSFLTFVEKHEDILALQNSFKKARLYYKNIEFLSEYYFPTTSKAINGAPIPEVEPDNPKYPTEPSGFQVIEELIFSGPVVEDTAELLVQAKLLQSSIVRLQRTTESLELTDAHVWDAIRLECFRIITLGISGYDSPIAQFSLPEAAAALTSLGKYLSLYTTTGTNEQQLLKKSIDVAINYLHQHSNFNDFNRAVFITSFMNPTTLLLREVQDQLAVPYFNEPRPLSSKATSLFDTSAWNSWYYSTNYEKPSNATVLEEIGNSLFYEPLLSGNNIRTCASCHQPEKAFTDGLTKNKSFDGTKVILRNTPSILFAAMQPAQFADTRVSFLEDQAKQVIENPEEMHGNLSKAVFKLKGKKKYDALFTAAFGKPTATEQQLQSALAAYMRTKSVFNSRFDQYMQGNVNALTTTEIKGFNLFMGKAKCGTCHFMPLFNGTVPPNFLKIETEVLGVPEQYQSPYKLDPDLGKYNLVPATPYLHSFKTTTARNAEKTAPFMHNGAIKTLEALIEFYNKGGGVGLGLDIPNQTLPPDDLKLDKAEQVALISFLKSLTNQ